MVLHFSQKTDFSNNKGKIVTVSIDNFDLPAHSVLEGQIIRCSDNDGVYIVGCQMPEDNYYIMEYVEQMIRTQKIITKIIKWRKAY